MEEEIHHQCPYKYSPASLHHYASQYVVELQSFSRPWAKTEKRAANQRKMPVHPWYSSNGQVILQNTSG
jgi:hypothetical protein